MFDLHCHILPDVDDGPRDLPEALAVARFCVRDGITHIAATPHCHRTLRLLRKDILPVVAGFNAALASEGLPLTVLPGAEIQVTDAAAYRRDYEAGVYCHLGDDPAYTLLEFPWDHRRYPPDARALVQWLVQNGTTPVLAHPERYGYFATDLERVRELVDAGAWLQITVDSLIGNHGPNPWQAGWDLLRAHPACVLSTDAHRPSRCSGLSVGFREVEKQLGPVRAQELRERADHILQHILAAQQAPANE